jgi:hypothetical protein
MIELIIVAHQQTCMRLKAKMENYEGLAQFDAAAEQYKSKDR